MKNYKLDKTGPAEEPYDKNRHKLLICHEALRFYDMGLFVIPLTFGGKKPVVKYKSFKSRPPRELIETWFKKDIFNIGILTGKRSGVVVVDADDLKAIQWAESNLPSTQMRTKTKRGPQLYFRCPETVVRNRTKIKIGGTKFELDVKGEGGVVVAPGSLHPASDTISKETFKRMSAKEKLSHALKHDFFYSEDGDWSKINLQDLPIFDPKWISDDAGEKTANNNSAADSATESFLGIGLVSRLKVRIEKYIEKSAPAVEGQAGDETTFRIACDLTRGFNLSDEQSLPFIKVWNNKCQPPWTEQELIEKIHSARATGTGKFGYLLHGEEPDTKLVSDTNAGFQFVSVSDFLIQPKPKELWLIDKFLPKVGSSLTFGKPKIGKTTTIRQVMKDIAEGTPFLGRTTKQGKVLYLALEENPEMWREYFRSLSPLAQKNIMLHYYEIPKDPIEHLKTAIEQFKPDLVVVDTMQKLLRLQETNEYGKAYNAIGTLTDLARVMGIHLLGVHHATKGDSRGFDSIMGSSAFRGAVDTNISIFEDHGYRYIESEGRYGDPIKKSKLLFDEDTQIVSLCDDNDEVAVKRRSKEIITHLIKQGVALSFKNIRQELGGREEILKKSVKRLVEDNEIERLGKGHKRDPYKYQAIEKVNNGSLS